MAETGHRENDFFVDSEKLSEAALAKKHRLESDPSSRADHMEYMPGMEKTVERCVYATG